MLVPELEIPRRSAVVGTVDPRGGPAPRAVSALKASTSLNWRVSSPGMIRAVQLSPPSVVRAKVPPWPLTHTTWSLTGLTA